ncbi:MAG: hypothetical protein ABI047_02670 [Jatrophihabitantaceae bacterium]
MATGLYLTLINVASESGNYLGVVEALRLAASVVAVAAFLVWRAAGRDKVRPSAPVAPAQPNAVARKSRGSVLALFLASSIH